MKKYALSIAVAAAILVVGFEVQAADVKGFRSASFGASEKAVIEAAVADLKVKASDIQRAQDSLTKVTTLTTKLKSFEPLGVPATVSYILGYKCNCLTQIVVSWDIAEKASIEQRKTAMLGVAALTSRFAGDTWEKDETVTNRAIGEVKEGSQNSFIFFRGQNKNGGAITLTGTPVKMVKSQKSDKKDDGLSADIDDLKTILLIYEKNALNPDIYRVDVTGF